MTLNLVAPGIQNGTAQPHKCQLRGPCEPTAQVHKCQLRGEKCAGAWASPDTEALMESCHNGFQETTESRRGAAAKKRRLVEKFLGLQPLGPTPVQTSPR